MKYDTLLLYNIVFEKRIKWLSANISIAEIFCFSRTYSLFSFNLSSFDMKYALMSLCFNLRNDRRRFFTVS